MGRKPEDTVFTPAEAAIVVEVHERRKAEPENRGVRPAVTIGEAASSWTGRRGGGIPRERTRARDKTNRNPPEN